MTFYLNTQKRKQTGLTNINIPKIKGVVSEEGLIHLPQNIQWKVIKCLHDSCHFGRDKLMKFCSRLFTGKGLQKTVIRISQGGPLCAINNPQGSKQPPPLVESIQRRGAYPGEDCQLDFTQMPLCQGFKYLLVFTDTFTGWVEAFSTMTEKAQEVPKILLKKLLPWFRLPWLLQSDNSPANRLVRL